LIALLVLGASVAPVAAAPVFKLADDSALVVRGVVDDLRSYKDGTFLVFTVVPRTILKGQATTGVPIQLFEERVFGTERPYFTKGAEALVFAVPLPPYSYYRQTLPAGTYFEWTDPKDSAEEIAQLADSAVVDAVHGYLATNADPAARARHLGAVLASPLTRLRNDALVAVESQPETARAFDASALEPLRTLLRDEHVPLAERGAILVRLGRVGAPGAVGLAEGVVGTKGPLQAAAVEALIALKHPPREEQLLEWSRNNDAALRLAAVRGLATSSSRTALDRVTDIVAKDPVADVRIAAIDALAASPDARAVPILAAALGRSDKSEILAASDALARIGTPEAVRALGEALRDGSFDAEVAAAFALKQSDRGDADAILREQRDAHPDARVRRVIKLALGEKLEEHDD
jgi:hypothetical protein